MSQHNFVSMSKKAGECGGLEKIAGRWKVARVPAETRDEGAHENEDLATRELTGLVVVIESQGEVSWKIPASAPERVVLFETNSAFLHKKSLTFLGGEHGWSLTFQMRGEPENGWMVLEPDPGEEGIDLTLSLTKERTASEVVDECFSLKKALDESLFSDLSFVCSDGRELQAHRAVLAAAYPAMQDKDWLALFKMQPSDMGHLLLTCVYSDCLPRDLTVDRAKLLLAWLKGQPLMERLSSLISAFIEANNLKQKLITLVDELLTILQDAKKTVSNLTMTDSAKVKYTLKQLGKDAIVGGAKICLLCQLYTRNKKEMSKVDRREVLEYLRARVVMFIDLVKELAVEAVEKWVSLSQEDQLELATDLIPDVEQVWDQFLKYATGLQVSVSQAFEHRFSEAQTGTGVTMLLHLLSRRSERKRLHKIRKEFLESVEMAQSKRERWKRYSEDEKARQVITVANKLVSEAEDLQLSMESRKRQLLLENGLEWKAFLSYVDIVCMYMTWCLQKALTLRDSLKHLLFEGLRFVGKSEVNEVLVFLGLVGEEELETWLEETSGDTQSSSEQLPVSLSPLSSSVEPSAGTVSVLAQGCLRLSHSQEFADMKFVLGGKIIPAHRVIVASRCEWASRALQSGMKEETERSINVSGVEEDVFCYFIKYLYGGSLNTAEMTTEVLIDLMAIADRFDESNLVSVCEELLTARIDDSSVFQLLCVAETLNKYSLRESSFQHILQRPEVVVEADGFTLLPQDLQQKVRALLSGGQYPTLEIRHSRLLSAHPTDSTVGRADSSGSGASSEDEEELQLESDHPDWEIALENLRAVIGSEVTDDTLRDLLLAADMDVNRAVNFFFNTQ